MLVVEQCTRDRCVTLGTPSADAVAISAGMIPSKHAAIAESATGVVVVGHQDSTGATRAGRAGRLVEDLGDRELAGHDAVAARAAR